MASVYPTAIDTFTNPSAADALSSAVVPHATQHANANDAIEAIEAKLGTGAGVRNTGADSRFGAGADGGAGTFTRIGDLGDLINTYVTAEGSVANVGLALRSKGTSVISMQQQDGAGLASFVPRSLVAANDTCMDLVIHNGTLTNRRVLVGAADSAGTGFRTLRVAN